MKNLIWISLCIAVLTSCSVTDEEAQDSGELNTPLVGRWDLTGILLDPGDGTGEFNTVSSDKALIFQPNGEIYSNYDHCGVQSSTTFEYVGTYYTNGEIQAENCQDGGAKMVGYEISNQELIISYVCIEACKEKYVKVN